MTTTICTVIPTLTSIQLISSVVDVTSFSQSTISVTGNASTITITQTCDDIITMPVTGTPPSNTPTCLPTIREVIITGAVFESVIQVPITFARVDIQTATKTFFATSCSTSTSSSSTSTSKSTSPSPTSSSSTSPIVSQDPPGFVVSNSTHTHTDATPSSSATLVSEPDGGPEEKIGPILGGTLGGVILLAAVVWFALRYFIRPGRFKQTISDGGSTKEHNMDLLEDDDSDYGQYGYPQRYQDSPPIQHQQYAWDRPTTNEGSDETIEEYSSIQPMRPSSALYLAPLSPLTPAINHHRFSGPPEVSIFPGHASMGEYNPPSHSSHSETHTLIGHYR